MQYTKINNRFLRFLPAAILVFGMTSCLKDNPIPPSVDGTATSVVEFGDIEYPESFGTDPLCYDNNGLTQTSDTTSIDIMVDYAGSQLDVPEDVTVNLVYDSASAALYNNEEGLGYTILPASAVSFPASVTIAKGTHLAYAHVVLNTTGLNDSTAYSIGMGISSVSYGILSGNHASAVYEFGLGN
jgi:hypothetical protein